MDINQERVTIAIDTIRETIKIRDVLISEKADYSRSKGLINCLFHSEKAPSMSIDNDMGVFNCFSCGRKGTVINLIQECEKVKRANPMNFYETVEYILQAYPEIAKLVGFTTIFFDEIERSGLARDADGNPILTVSKLRKPRLPDDVNIQALMKRLRRSMALEGPTPEMVSRVCNIISCCEYGMPAEIVNQVFTTGEFRLSSEPQVDINEEVLADFDFIFQQANEDASVHEDEGDAANQ